MDLEEIRRIKEAAEAELLKLPGVTGVDIGFKTVRGKPTDVMAIRVYVDRKRNVPAEQEIPTQIQGVPTDVIERSYGLHHGRRAQEVKDEDPQ